MSVFYSQFFSRSKTIFNLALPIIAAMLSQNLVNLVDTAMVGQLGSDALGAVGMGSMANWLAAAFFNGLGAGVQVITARRMGQGNRQGAIAALNTALVIIVIVVLPYSFFLSTQTRFFFSKLTNDPSVMSLGANYLAIRLYAAVFVIANFSFRGYWNGIKRPTIYLKTILVIHSVNIMLNYLLIFGKFGFPRLGVQGAAIGSAIAVGVGTLIHLIMAWRVARHDGFFRFLRIDFHLVKNVFRFSAPTGVQMVFLSGGFVAFYRIADLLGTAQLAATNVLVNLSLVCVLPAMGFGLAATTLVGHALGERQISEAKRWGWYTTAIAAMLMALLGGLLASFPRLWLSLLMKDPIAIEYGIVPLVILGLLQAIDGMGIVLSQTLIGAGAVRAVMLGSIFFQWFVFIPLAYFWGTKGGGGMIAIWLSMAIYRSLFAFSMLAIFARGRWVSIRV